MLNTYLEVAQALRRQVPEIMWIDLDQGQIDALLSQDENYEIDIPTTPCVFISVPEEEWRQLSNKSQTGIGQLVVTLLLQLPSSTSASDPLISLSVEKLQLANTVHEAVLSVGEVEHRTRTRRMPVRHLYAVSHYYEVRLSYTRQNRTTPKPNPLITTSLNLNFPIGQS